MNGPSGAGSWTQLAASLRALSASGELEIRENGNWLAELDSARCELRLDGPAPLLHVWSGGRDLTRRLLRVAEYSPQRVVIEVLRFGRDKPGKIEVALRDSQRPAGRLRREQFRAWLRRILAEQFPDSEIESLTLARDLENSFSDVYVRGRMRDRAQLRAVLAASSSETAAAIEGMLTFAILWLDWVRAHSREPVAGIRLFVPPDSAQDLAPRLAGLAASLRVEIFEFSEAEAAMRKLDPAETGNLDSRLVPRPDAELSLAAGQRALDDIRRLAPAAAPFIRPRLGAASGEIEFCFRGLRFAVWSALGGISYGTGDHLRKLAADSEADLRRLLDQLILHRSPVAENSRHPFYRDYPERWLEAIIAEDPLRLDPRLDPRYLYSQVPAVAGRDHRILDLLGITRAGRLVIIELKAAENLHMPIQALDYWLRVRHHQIEGNFHRLGYFPGAEISPDPPLVWLVAPSLRFHPGMDIVLKYLARDVRVTRIGIAENWRRGIRVVLRQ